VFSELLLSSLPDEVLRPSKEPLMDLPVPETQSEGEVIEAPIT
jgi:hypothetical protein